MFNYEMTSNKSLLKNNFGRKSIFFSLFSFLSIPIELWESTAIFRQPAGYVCTFFRYCKVCGNCLIHFVFFFVDYVGTSCATQTRATTVFRFVAVMEFVNLVVLFLILCTRSDIYFSTQKCRNFFEILILEFCYHNFFHNFFKILFCVYIFLGNLGVCCSLCRFERNFVI